MVIPKKLLQKYNIRPSRRLGQNFLIDKKVLGKIIQTADLSPNDVVLEVGPGLGILTLELAKCVKKVIAVEKDKRMIEILRKILAEKNIKNVEIVEGDILKLKLPFLFCHPEPFDSAQDKLREGSHNQKEKDSLPSAQNDKARLCDYKIIANIPYYLTSPLIRKFLESKNQPEFMLLMIQKEVAMRICASPRQGRGSPKAAPKMTLLSVATQFYAEPKIISSVSKKAFWPQPKVDSAIIKIVPRSFAYSSALFRDHFFKVVKAGFSQPRKQLVNNLSKGLSLSREETKKILLKAELQPTQRPSELSVDKWLEIAWIIWGK